jgi:hypothetical protein
MTSVHGLAEQSAAVLEHRPRLLVWLRFWWAGLAVAVSCLSVVVVGMDVREVHRTGVLPNVMPFGGGDSRALFALPRDARAPVSAALGRQDPGYAVHGLVAANPAQELTARFTSRGVDIAFRADRVRFGPWAIGRGGDLRVVDAAKRVFGLTPAVRERQLVATPATSKS